MNAKTKAIVAHITLIGWIIAFVINNSEKEELASYYIRQTLGIYLLGIACSIISVIPIIGWIVGIVGSLVTFVFWIMSLIWAINGEMKPVPWLGGYFQDWFKSF
ncbi:MAG: hypothetical protein FWG22_05515 [Prolixibacteraceae bacterium]|nr:hypothetical protein [Prolixibacteraceae bacterium]